MFWREGGGSDSHDLVTGGHHRSEPFRFPRAAGQAGNNIDNIILSTAVHWVKQFIIQE